MSNELIPSEPTPQGPQDDPTTGSDRCDDDGAQSRKQRQRRRGHVLSVDDCLCMLSQLPSLITLNAITPSKANAIKGALQAVLAELRGTHAARPAKELNDNLIAQLRNQPELLHSLEPLLSDEHVDEILRGVKDDTDKA